MLGIHSKLNLKDKTNIHDHIIDVFGKESRHYSFQTIKTKKLFMVAFVQNMKNVSLWYHEVPSGWAREQPPLREYQPYWNRDFGFGKDNRRKVYWNFFTQNRLDKNLLTHW